MLWHSVDNSSYQGCSLPERVELYDDEVTGEKSSFAEDNALPPNNVEWVHDSSQLELPKPVTDEAEWSDGWRSN